MPSASTRGACRLVSRGTGPAPRHHRPPRTTPCCAARDARARRTPAAARAGGTYACPAALAASGAVDSSSRRRTRAAVPPEPAAPLQGGHRNGRRLPPLPRCRVGRRTGRPLPSDACQPRRMSPAGSPPARHAADAQARRAQPRRRRRGEARSAAEPTRPAPTTPRRHDATRARAAPEATARLPAPHATRTHRRARLDATRPMAASSHHSRSRHPFTHKRPHQDALYGDPRTGKRPAPSRDRPLSASWRTARPAPQLAGLTTT